MMKKVPQFKMVIMLVVCLCVCVCAKMADVITAKCKLGELELITNTHLFASSSLAAHF